MSMISVLSVSHRVSTMTEQEHHGNNSNRYLYSFFSQLYDTDTYDSHVVFARYHRSRYHIKVVLLADIPYSRKIWRELNLADWPQPA